MGGSALKNSTIQRMTRAKYFETIHTLKPIITKYFENVATPLVFGNKQSFGDIDIFVASPKYQILDIRQRLAEELNSKECCFNGPVDSYEYNNIQLDIIKIDNTDSFEGSIYYFNWGDFR